MRFSYDQRTDSLEYVIAACQVLRGSCDYRSGKDEEFDKFMTDAWGGDSPNSPDGSP
jgi:hypothetical protein